LEKTIEERVQNVTNHRLRKKITAQARLEIFPENLEKVTSEDLFNNMPLPSDAKKVYANWFFTHKAQPVGTVATTREMLNFRSKLPQVCFMGRSNVGKSSLLNALVGIPRLANTSATPGCTKTINFYSIGQKMMLTDLPGFGHADVGKKRADDWLDLVKLYMKRAIIRRAFLLIDCRRGLQQIDLETMELYAKHNICYQIVLTKIDQLKAHEVEALRAKIHSQTANKPLNFPEVLVSSSHHHYGIDMLRAHCLEACGLTGVMSPTLVGT